MCVRGCLSYVKSIYLCVCEGGVRVYVKGICMGIHISFDSLFARSFLLIQTRNSQYKCISCFRCPVRVVCDSSTADTMFPCTDIWSW